jgi:hypothetical protein
MSEKLNSAMQRVNRDVQLLGAKACFPRGKDLLVPRWTGVEPGALLEEFVESRMETLFAGKQETAHVHCECHGIRHIAKKCPAQEKRRGKTRNSPGRSKPSEILLLQGNRLNPGN